MAKSVRLRYMGGCSCEYPAPEGPMHVDPGQIITVPADAAERLLAGPGWQAAKPAEKGE